MYRRSSCFPDSGNTHLTCEVPLSKKDHRLVQVEIWAGEWDDRETAHTPAYSRYRGCCPSKAPLPAAAIPDTRYRRQPASFEEATALRAAHKSLHGEYVI